MPLSRAKPINDLENRHLLHLKVVKKSVLRKCNYKAIMGGKLQLDKVQSQETREHSLTQFLGEIKNNFTAPKDRTCPRRIHQPQMVKAHRFG